MEVSSILLNRLIAEGSQKNATGLYLSIGSKPVLKIYDQLVVMESENIINIELLNSLINMVLNQQETEKLNKEREIVIVSEFASHIRLRVNIYYQKGLPTITFHFISNAIKTLDELGLSSTITRFLNLESGLLLFAGPFGSGKTATASAFIEEINRTQSKYIITLENLIETIFVSKKSIINQRQVGRDVNTMEEGLNYCMSEDMDIVYITEIEQDAHKSFPSVINLSAGNSLALLEFNATGSVSAIEKLIDILSFNSSIEAARHSIADVLEGIIVHRLLPRVGGGLVLANEILVATPTVKSFIREGRIQQIEGILQTSRREGMVNMERSIDELRIKGLIK